MAGVNKDSNVNVSDGGNAETRDIPLSSSYPGGTNPNRHSMSTGTVNNVFFTVCCCGSSLLVMDKNLKTIQEIVEDGVEIFKAVDSCHSDGKLVVCGEQNSGTKIIVYRPTAVKDASHGFPYQWQKMAILPTAGECDTVSWNPLGDRFVVGGEHITTWWHRAVATDLSDRDSFPFAQELDEDVPYLIQSSRPMPSPVTFLSYSPDGRVFASAANNDRLIKVWYTLSQELVKFSPLNTASFIYLEHPMAVTAFSWRKVSDIKMHSVFVKNVLVSSCQDMVCRIWAETDGQDPLGFYLATVIDPRTYSGLESITSSFTLHWLNTKDIRQELLEKTDKLQSTVPDFSGVDTFATNPLVSSRFDAQPLAQQDSDYIMLDVGDVPKFTGVQSPKAVVYRQFDVDGRDFAGDGASCHTQIAFRRGQMGSIHKPFSSIEPADSWPDVLFFVAVDGSLIFWSIGHLDEYPRRDPSVKYISRTNEGIIPPIDAGNITGNIVVFSDADVSNWKRCVSEKSIDSGLFEYSCRKSLSLSLLMHHKTGDVTKWCTAFADNSAFSDVLRVEQGSRCTGHSVPVDTIKSHPSSNFVLSVGNDFFGIEAMVWTVNQDTVATPQCDGVLGDANVYRCKVEGDELPVFSWLPSSKHIALIKSSPQGIQIIGLSPTSRIDRTLATFYEQPIGDQVWSDWHSIWAQSGSTDQGVDCFWVHGLHNNGCTLSVFRVLVKPNLSPSDVSPPTSAANASDQTTSPEVEVFLEKQLDLGITSISSAFMFLHSTDYVEECKVAGERNSYLGVVTNEKELKIWELQCSLDFYGKPSVSIESIDVTHNMGTTFENPIITSSLGGVLAIRSAREARSVELTGLHLTGVGLKTMQTLQFTNDVFDLSWGATSNWKDALLVLTSSHLEVFVPTTSSFNSGLYTKLLRTDVSATCVPSSLLAHTAAGVVLMVSGKAIRAQSVWNKTEFFSASQTKEEASTDKDDEEERAAAKQENTESSRLQRIQTVDELLNTRQIDLPQYHPEQLAEFVLSGQTKRMEAILKHIAACFRKEKSLESLVGSVAAPVREVQEFKIPPVELHKVWCDEDQTSSSSKVDNYDGLFQISIDGHANAGPGGSNDADYICEQLAYKSLPGLSRLEQAATAALLESTAEIEQNRQSLDECGIRFFVPLLQKTVAQRSSGRRGRNQGSSSPSLGPSDYVWALHSNAQERLLELCPGIGKNPAYLWEDFRAVGAGYWLQNMTTLKQYAEQIAKNTFQKEGNTVLDAALWYCAMKKKSMLWGLFKSTGDQRMASFFGNDFKEARWKDAAANNAFKLLSMQRYHHSVAFFLLGGNLEEAAHVCKKNLNDPQLAIVLSRLYHDGESSECLESFLTAECEEETDPFRNSILHWLQKDYGKAFSHLHKTLNDDSASSVANAPGVLSLYRVLQTKNQVKKYYTEKGNPEKITAVPVTLFFKAYRSYGQRGMPLLALDTLSNYIKAQDDAKKLETNESEVAAPQTAYKARLFAPTSAQPPSSQTMDSGMLDFSSFGGFDDFSQFDELPTSTTDGGDDTNTANDVDEEDQTITTGWTASRGLVFFWQWQLCLRIVSHAVTNTTVGLSWDEFNKSLFHQSITAARICDKDAPGCESSIRRACLQLARSHNLPSLELALTSYRSNLGKTSGSILGFIDALVDELVEILVDFVQAYSDDAKKIIRVKPTIVCARAKMLADEISTCLHHVTLNAQSEDSCPSPVKLAEYVCVVYSALVFVAWKEKNTASLLQLFTNIPNARLWSHLVPGATSPVEAEQLITSRDAATVDPAKWKSLMSYVKRPVSPGLYTDVDAGAEWTIDGSEVLETIHPSGSTEHKLEQFRWFLMDFAAAQYGVEMLRDVVRCTVPIDVSLVDQVSLKLHRILEALEEFTAVAQLKLCALSAPYDESLVSDSKSMVASSTQSSKIRRIRDIKNNIFQTIPSRRLWDFLARQNRLQHTLVHHLIGRPSRMYTDEIRVGDWVTAKRESTEIYCMCNVSRHPDSLVIGTSKGVVELHLQQNTDDNSSTPSNLLTAATPSFGIKGGASSPSFDIPSRSRSASPRTTQLQMEDQTSENQELYVQGQVRPSQGQIRSIAQHPNMPCYISGTSHGDIQLWHFNQQHALGSFRTDKKDQLNQLRFSTYGNTFGACNSGGDMMLWRFLSGDDSDDPFLTIKANSKRTDDFAFMCSTSLLVTGGWSSDGGNVNLWDTMLISTDRFSVAHAVRSYDCNEGGTRALAYSPTSQRLICGSHKGEIAVIDFRQQTVIKSWMAHEGSVNKLIIDEAHDAIITGSSSGDIKLWSLNSLRQTANYEGLHARSTFFKSGVVDMALQGDKLFTCGIDGNIKCSVPWIPTRGSRSF